MERLKIQYEWSIEHVDSHGDIKEVHHVDKLSELSNGWDEPMAGCEKVEIALSRIEYTNSDGMEDREYFYPDANGELLPLNLPNMTARKSKQHEYKMFCAARLVGSVLGVS